MARITELDKQKKAALQAAFDFNYATEFVRGIILSTSAAQINQWMIAARHSEKYETEDSVRYHLAREGIKVPNLRTTADFSWVD